MATTMAPLSGLRLYMEVPLTELQGVSWEGFEQHQKESKSLNDTNEQLRDYVWNHCQEQLIRALRIVPAHSINEPIVSLESPEELLQVSKAALPTTQPKEQLQQQQWMQEDLCMAAKKLKLLERLADAHSLYLNLQGPEVVFRRLTETLLEIMDAQYGFLAEVQVDANEPENPSFQMHAVSNAAWSKTTTETFHRDMGDPGWTFHDHAALYGHILRSKKPIIGNSPISPADPNRPMMATPGHPPDTFLAIPLFDSRTGEINGIVGLANKVGGFSPQDVEFLEPCVHVCGNLIQAYKTWMSHSVVPETPPTTKQQNLDFSSHRSHPAVLRQYQQRILELELANVQLTQAREHVLQQSAAQLRHFACSSHEIRTPLNCIVGLSSLLQETELNPMQAEWMQLISSSSELLLTVVNDVLDYSKLESGHVDVSVKPSNLQEVLLGVVQSMELKTRDKNIRVRTEYSPLLPPIFSTDRLRLQQILFNLLGNAFKFSEPDTCIDLLVQIGPPGRPTGSHATPLTVPRVIRFVVQDHGCGIHPSQLESIFQPFVQAGDDTKRSYEGTGLGLAITSKLVQALGGCVYANSTLHVGSEFVVELPFTDQVFDVAEMKNQWTKTTVLLIPGQNMPEDQIPFMQEILEAYQVPYQTLSSMDDLDHITLRNAASGVESWGMISDDSASSTATTGTQAPIVLPDDHAYICLIDESVYVREVMQRWKEQPVSTVLLTFGPDYTVAEASHHYRNLLQIVPSVLMQSLADAVEEVVARTSSGSRQPRRRSLTQPNKRKKKKKPPVVSLEKEDVSILIVEDNVINQKVLKALLKKLGYTRTCVVGDGQQAVDAVEEHKYDVVLMDVQMPVMDGIEATRVIGERQRQKSLDLGNDKVRAGPLVVFVTASVDQALEEEAKVLGAVGFVPKPFNLRQLETCMTEICRTLG